MLLMIHKKYPSKVLLFGEYAVLYGGQALAVPFPGFNGKWVPDPSGNNHFLAFFRYLLKVNNSLKSTLNISSLETFLENGARFESSIPMGVGLGSSAALTASIYDQFSDHKYLNVYEKMEDLALIESFFHGRSSGFDALVSLLQTPILIKRGTITPLENRPKSSLYCYLLFTNKKRHTQELVDWFQKERKDPEFAGKMQQYSLLSNQCIDDYVSDKSDLFETTRMLSECQFYNLNRLVVSEIKDLWASSLTHDDFTIKLCGAGGGGCYLVMAPKPLQQERLEGFKIQTC